MAKVIVYERPGGAVSVVHLALNDRRPEETEDQQASRWLGRHLPADATEPAVIDAATLPAGRRWRAAWRIVGGAVVVELLAAKVQRALELTRERVRVMRELSEALEAAVDAGQTLRAAQLRARRLTLRNWGIAADLQSLGTVAEVEAFQGISALTDPI
jgi:hypothetical protein